MPARSRGENTFGTAAGIGREALVFLAFLALTALMTWPWITRMATHVTDPGDPYINSWILWWDYHATFNEPWNLFHGNIFFPYRYSLAFSEHNYGIALLVFPFFAMGLAPLTVHGIAVFLALAFSGYGAFRLARTLSGDEGLAWLAGIAFAFYPYHLYHLPHVNYLFAGWIPILLEALVLFARERSWRRAVWLGAAFLMNGLTCVHWFVLTLLPLGLTGCALVFAKRRELTTREAYRGALTLGTAGLLLLPFLLPYRKAAELYGFVRYRGETLSYSATAIDWLTVNPNNKLWSPLNLGDPARPFERGLFPGALLPILALVALAFAHRRAPRLLIFIGALWLVVGVLFSFGLNLPFHTFLYDHVSLFRSIRAPARWAMLAGLGLALLAALGARNLASLAGRWARLAMATAALALLFEFRVAPLELYRGDAKPDEMTRHLAATPMRGGIVALPAGSRGNYLHTLRAADHGKPLVNAVSGFRPPLVAELEGLLAQGPIPYAPLMDLLESIPVSYLAIYGAQLLPDERAQIRWFLAQGLAEKRLRFVARFDCPARNELWAITKTAPGTSDVPLPWVPPVESPGESARRRTDENLWGSIDEPAEDAVVEGELLVRGWARVAGETLHVRVFLDGEERQPLSGARTPRPDVAAVLPQLAPADDAGYEARYALGPDEACEHTFMVEFLSKDGRVRVLTRRFFWKPARASSGTSPPPSR